jgi:PEP-CTERM motif
MKIPIWFARVVSVLAVLVAVGIADAVPNVPPGVTGLWRFQTDADKLKATIGADLTTSDPAYNTFWAVGPWTVIEPGLSDNGIVQETSWQYLTVYHGIGANGGGSYVNEYTVAIDYVQTQAGWNSLFATSWDAHSNDGDLWIAPDGTIGVGDAGYSTLTFDPSQWHRIVWSIDNGNFFRVYVDGVLFLDGIPQAVDGRFSLEVDWEGQPGRFHLFADNDWEDMWGYVSTAAVWDHALTSAEVAAMGSASTPLEIPEPATLGLLALGGLALLRRRA